MFDKYNKETLGLLDVAGPYSISRESGGSNMGLATTTTTRDGYMATTTTKKTTTRDGQMATRTKKRTTTDGWMATI